MLPESYINPLDSEYLSINDVSLVPKRGILKSRNNAKLEPFIYSAPMDTVTGSEMVDAIYTWGFPVMSRFPIEEWKTTLFEYGDGGPLYFAIGAQDTDLQELDDLVSKNKPSFGGKWKINIAVDTAHGHSDYALQMIYNLRRKPYINYIMSGSICTPEAALECIAAGATHLRVGIGPGSACTTRLQTGIGVPNLSAVYNIWKALQDGYAEVNLNGVIHILQFDDPSYYKIIADGGIWNPGDAVKYLAAGANGIMLGLRLSLCKESPGWKETEFGTKVKTYRGQASSEFQNDIGRSNKFIEGVSSTKMTRNEEDEITAQQVFNEFHNGVASAISYLGLTSIQELNPDNVEFIKITPSGYNEGLPHV